MKHASYRIVYLILSLSFLSLSGWAIKWFNPMQTGFPVVQNQAFVEELSQSYHRLPDRAKPLVRDAVWNLSQNSAGLAIHFYSNSPEIKIRYRLVVRLPCPTCRQLVFRVLICIGSIVMEHGNSALIRMPLVIRLFIPIQVCQLPPTIHRDLNTSFICLCTME